MPKKGLVKAVLGRNPDVDARILELQSGEKHPIFDNVLYRKFAALVKAGKPVPNHIAMDVKQLIEHPPTDESTASAFVALIVWQEALRLRKRKDGTFKPLTNGNKLGDGDIFEKVGKQFGLSGATVKKCFYSSKLPPALKSLRSKNDSLLKSAVLEIVRRSPKNNEFPPRP